jgi:hypothetical protein
MIPRQILTGRFTHGLYEIAGSSEIAAPQGLLRSLGCKFKHPPKETATKHKKNILTSINLPHKSQNYHIEMAFVAIIGTFIED